MRGVSLEELSSATRINPRYLTAIENGHWEELPGGAFNRGFIRSASRYLGLDEDGMVAEYSLETKGDGWGQTKAQPVRVQHDWKRIAISAGVLILLIAGIWFAGAKVIGRLRSRPIVVAPAAQSQGTGGSRVATAAGAPLQLSIRGVLTAKLQVIADGKVVAEELIRPNQEQHFSAKDDFQVTASDGAAVRLELNGQPIAQIGPSRLPGTITLTAKDLKSSAGGNH